MTIAEVSKRFNLSADTLRYYERIGLIPSVNRNASGIRDYTEEDCNWVNFIKCMRSAGLSIEVLVEYVSMFQQGTSTIKARKELLIEQRSQLAEKIKEMQQTLERLDKKIDGYEERVLIKEGQLKRTDN
ncbi:MerR family transcriptional regulator [Clostridium sp. OS1-26]|uniref:MerR family transcriptional regulator n=1 Tax=Clostridium sp. OS1-26 TaxID=3070681 RepID=UPI0027E1E5D4|nr:MerR family transcriptional regulator [Clostridium sp. OS1-26]WML34270.1 MerR family transcriptional regulator [Clostridium sp. OS1-26]